MYAIIKVESGHATVIQDGKSADSEVFTNLLSAVEWVRAAEAGARHEVVFRCLAEDRCEEINRSGK